MQIIFNNNNDNNDNNKLKEMIQEMSTPQLRLSFRSLKIKEINDKTELKTHDGLLELMDVIVRQFESNASNYILYSNIFQSISISRIMLDILLKQAVELGYINLDKDGDVVLLEKGKVYAINNNLV